MSNKLRIVAPILLISLILLLIGLLVNFSVVNNERDSDKLIFAQTICRHGERNIYKSYDSDPYGDESYWPGGFAALTDVGKQQHIALGRYLRQRYDELVQNDEFSSDEMFVQSSAVKRVLLGAQFTLAGFFSPLDQNNRNWSKQIELQSIPIFTVPVDEDFFLASEKQCDRYDYEMINYINTTEYQSMFEENKLQIAYLEEKTGQKLSTYHSMNHVYDRFSKQKQRGFRLSDCAQEAIRIGGAADMMSRFAYQISTSTIEMQKLKSGYLLEELLDRSMNKTHHLLVPDRSLWLLFAHDTTIANMLNSLGLFEPHRPSFTSCLLFELYETETGDYLQVFYKNSTEKDIPALEIPGCGTKCPVYKWYEVYKDILPTRSFEEECELHEGESLPASGNPEKLVH